MQAIQLLDAHGPGLWVRSVFENCDGSHGCSGKSSMIASLRELYTEKRPCPPSSSTLVFEMVYLMILLIIT
jgi:hypothetical protein